MEETVSVRIPKEELKEIEELGKSTKRKRSDILREVIYKGIMEKRLELALEKFQNNEATAWKAASIAGIPLTQFMEILNKKGINFHYDIEELRKEFEELI